MALFSKIPLSGSTNGRGIAVVATGSPGTTIHTATSSTEGFDEIWIYAVNSSASSVKLTLEFGGTSTSDQIEITIPSESGLTLIAPGLMLQNSNIVRAFAGTTNVISVFGYVNRAV
jgi:hypothetical protein